MCVYIYIYIYNMCVVHVCIPLSISSIYLSIYLSI